MHAVHFFRYYRRVTKLTSWLFLQMAPHLTDDLITLRAANLEVMLKIL